MKKTLINLIINACYRIDNKRGALDHYEYETAPYCGYHKSGTNGFLYNSSYAEGDGIEYATILGFRFTKSTDDEYWWSFRYKFKIVKDLYISGIKECTDMNWTNISIELDSFIKINIKSKHMRFKYKLKKKW